MIYYESELVTVILILHNPCLSPTGDYDVLDFGDCHVDYPHQECFTMTNHSSSQVLRFEWPPAGPHVSFSPQVKYGKNGQGSLET